MFEWDVLIENCAIGRGIIMELDVETCIEQFSFPRAYVIWEKELAGSSRMYNALTCSIFLLDALASGMFLWLLVISGSLTWVEILCNFQIDLLYSCLVRAVQI